MDCIDFRMVDYTPPRAQCVPVAMMMLLMLLMMSWSCPVSMPMMMLLDGDDVHVERLRLTTATRRKAGQMPVLQYSTWRVMLGLKPRLGSS